MTQNSDLPKPRVRLWLATGSLTFLGVLAGGFFESALCYWQARTFWPQEARPLSNWSDELLPYSAAFMVLGTAWIVAWFLYSAQTRRWGLGIAHALVPAAAFVLAVLHASTSAMACGAY